MRDSNGRHSLRSIEARRGLQCFRLQELNPAQRKSEDVPSESEVNVRIDSHQTSGLCV